ncbi:2-oxoacid:acceptor oxidoreductase subunit alpha [Rhodoplanes sp. TEM]|uniref:2-oxoacid:acceptor oxidoreductase subunit alpha n=1 Tax=Rhodoplanes tepidamans TaxID=200616 RepID=A0ABT5JKB9_RHOTP|nr:MULTISPECIES: 2-oxoacid:acceptor oxidoreductase subunit alpha [Rhodoplanes]MDC7789982.1 2-oxoacid:acceptor oxidoreductase subunit alpha [Rhodoplanes tepidamans]MDC7985359.1 2-oxoacid:acceptor oxidoreductase subunit alpha [Rhodoplanes sp. TEM]MDQ0359242.1 2-oxoglutarate ferredoxin oxidoreductase subunit alpha [Rhodoplanes tepidamans]
MTTLTALHGNHACALAAIAAGCRFFAGYPITPSSEIAEHLSHAMPKVGGTFVQMEDEIASIAAVIGASLGGLRAMTATSGPGFSLMQENIGYAAMVEAPCVIVDVMRGGPSTGMPTRPAQGDVMQARFGSHGDRPVVALAPASVQEIYTETIRAFDLAERLRTPVTVLYDQVIAQLLESVAVPAPSAVRVRERKWANGASGWEPYAADDDGVPAMARPGDGHRVHTTGLTHAESGFPTQAPPVVDRMMRRLLGKIDVNRALIEKHETLAAEDAEVLIVAYGITARAARRAVTTLRETGVKAGLFRPITLWPFPEAALARLAGRARAVLVPEMNAGQLVLEIQRIVGHTPPVRPLTRIDGEPIAPDEITAAVRELAVHA